MCVCVCHCLILCSASVCRASLSCLLLHGCSAVASVVVLTLVNRKVWLFHGTSEEAAHSIAKSDFRMPSSAGLFGKGLYFADVPPVRGDHMCLFRTCCNCLCMRKIRWVFKSTRALFVRSSVDFAVATLTRPKARE